MSAAASAVAANAAMWRIGDFVLMTISPFECPPNSRFVPPRAAASCLVPLDRRVHLDVAAALLRLLQAEREIVALDRHARLPFQVFRPIAEVIAMPWRLRLERWQAEALPDRLRLFHEFLLGQRDWRECALEHGV